MKKAEAWVMDEDAEPAFDWQLYGLLVRKERIRIGYRRAEDFAASIWRRTRVEVSRDTLYKVEQGRQIPDALQFMAINMALGFDPFLGKVVDMCISSEWKGASSPDGIPEKWKVTNFINAESKCGTKFESAEAAADACRDLPELFEKPED